MLPFPDRKESFFTDHITHSPLSGHRVVALGGRASNPLNVTLDLKSAVTENYCLCDLVDLCFPIVLN